MTRLAVLLKVARKKRNMRQPDLAKEIGVHPNTISRAENGERPNVNNLDRMAVFLGESPERLLEEVSEEHSLAALIPNEDDATPRLNTAAARQLIEVSSEAGMSAGEWIETMLAWLGKQTPEFQMFIKLAVQSEAGNEPVTETRPMTQAELVATRHQALDASEMSGAKRVPRLAAKQAKPPP